MGNETKLFLGLSHPPIIIPRVHFRKTALIGVGLLGGSLGLAIQRRKISERVVGYVRREASLAACREHGVVHEATMDLTTAVAGADLVIFCTPLAQMRELATKAMPHLNQGTIVTDVGSVKGQVVDEMEALFAESQAVFVGSHPMAGSEKTGPASAREDLFEKAVCIITPGSAIPTEPLQKLETFWTAVGCRVLRMAPEEHDDLTGRCSHLPHVVAAGLANYVLSPAHPPAQAELCATGFRDTTRVASGSTEMWRDIVMMNREHLQRVLGVFIEDLQEFRRAVQEGDEAAVVEFLQTAKERRDGWQQKFNERNQS